MAAKLIRDLQRRGVRVESIKTFNELRRIRNGFINGHKGYKTPFLIIMGPPGTAKTHVFEGSGVKIINTATSPVGLYTAVFQANGEPIILDDTDGLFDQPGATAIIKALGAEKPDKLVTWEKQNASLESQGIPRQFRTASRICIICNELPRVSRNMQAVFDRAKLVVFTPNAQEIHDYVGTWRSIEMREVHEFIGANLRLITVPSIRWYIAADSERKLGNNWQEWLIKQWCATRPLLGVVADILSKDQRFPTRDSQVEEFERQTKMSRATFGRYLKEYREIWPQGHLHVEYPIQATTCRRSLE